MARLRTSSALLASAFVGLAACTSPATQEGAGVSPDGTDKEPMPAVDPAASPEAGADDGNENEPEPEPEPTYEPKPEDVVTPHLALQQPEALATFFEALTAVDEGEQRVVRVVHLGASMIGADDLPGILRGKFQTRFGDGGAGLVLLARYHSNYKHQWVDLESRGWSNCYIAYKCFKDGRYGLGGAAFYASGGAKTTISTRNHELGDEASHLELWYLARPGGGKLELKVDEDEPQIVDTRSETLQDEFFQLDVPQGPHSVRVRSIGGMRSRAYGLVMETKGPGIVWDQFSMLGVFTKKILLWDPEHIQGQIKQRDPDLIVFTYGGNDSRRIANGKLTKEEYIKEYADAVAHVRAGKPEASCMITSLTDRARSLEFKIEPEHIELLADAQREVAKQSGCAFFDTFTAMGGGGSLKQWRRKDPPLAAPDLKHLNHSGRELVGGWMYDAVISAYVDYRKAAASNREGSTAP